MIPAAAGTLGGALQAAAGRLKAAGVEQPRREARLLVALSAGVAPEIVIGWPERALPDDAVVRLAALVARRCAGEPFSRMTGTREFWSMPFRLGSDTLDPRPDTETLVEAVLEAVPDRRRPLRILDLGTGSGCILLALLKEYPTALGVGLDVAAGACAVAAANAAALGLAPRAAFAVSDWAAAVGGRFDVVVSNPPYIPADEIAALDVAVRQFDPHRALAGGADGLSAYRAILADLPRLLSPGGVAVFEVGAGQARDVRELCRDAALADVGSKRDLAGIERCVLMQSTEKAG